MTTLNGLRFYTAMVSPNGRIKPDWVFIDGKEIRCPKGTYYIDYTDPSGQRVRTSVGALAAEAQATRLRKEAELRAIAQGLNVTSDGDRVGDTAKRPIALAVAEFLQEVQLTKDPKTFRGYDVALSYFRESCPKVHLESIECKDLLKFTASLKKEKKQSPRFGPQQVCLPAHLPCGKRSAKTGREKRPPQVRQTGSRNL